MTSIFWFRRDLRLQDNPALLAASEAGDVLPVFIFSTDLGDDFDRPRIQFLVGSLKALDSDLGSNLVIRYGDPTEILAELCAEVNASTVYSTQSYSTYRRQEDEDVAEGLGAEGLSLELIGTPYAVEPGNVFNKSDLPFKVFTPFYKAWSQHSVDEPLGTAEAKWVTSRSSQPLPEVSAPPEFLPAPGEAAAHARVEEFIKESATEYNKTRNNPGIDGTSKISHYLKWGTLHPRQVLVQLGDSPGEEVFRKEIAWREFYADVLFNWPSTANDVFNSKMENLAYDTGASADELFEAWAAGQTGYPIVDAGMRQLVETGWMHNRVRMIVASFLTKDLHIEWSRGAEFFMHHLADGDLASNAHGWQWTAGTGTDASPYFRVFNPSTQSKKFDPDGDYLREWLPEIAHLSNAHIHTPWLDPYGAPAGYPLPIVDHAQERLDALERYKAMKEALA